MVFEILSKTKTTKIIEEHLLEQKDFEILISVTSKTVSKPQQPQNLTSGFCFKLQF
jgi:hypothetical protein